MDGEDYQVQLVEEGLPQLRISGFYRRLYRSRRLAAGDRESIEEKVNSARWLIKSILQRQETILKVARSIVGFQRDFLDQGIGHLRPLVLRAVAEDMAHLVPWLEQTSRELALPITGTSIRCQKSRWGSCSSAKRINLNVNLLFVPSPLVRYLFIHELCHTKHMNHSERYWRLVESIEPGYRQLDEQLRKANHLVPVWALPE